MNTIRNLRRACVASLNAVLPHTPFWDRLVGLPGFYWCHRRLPRRPNHPQAWISDILFAHACSDDWTPLQRLCIDKVTAVDVARAAAPELRFARRHAVIDVPEDASVSDLQRLLTPFMGQPLVAKPAHSCGGLLFLEEQLSVQQWREFHRHAVHDYYELSRERLYRGLPKRIIIEDRLSERPRALVDYKLFCSRGHVFSLRIVADMLTKPRICYFRLPDCEPLPYSLPFPERDDQYLIEVMPIPEKLGELVAIAAKLSAPFDFLRADLYSLPDGIYFGEYTFLSSGGRSPILSMELSELLVQAVRESASSKHA